MPRYIDAYLLTADIQKYLCAGCSTRCTPFEIKNSVCEIAECLRMIYDAPTADVQEVRHGHWRKLSAHRDDDGYIVHDYECTWCFGIERDVPDVENSELEELDRYCPMCGAKMDGGDENENRVYTTI